jgi:hypothetical protein
MSEANTQQHQFETLSDKSRLMHRLRGATIGHQPEMRALIQVTIQTPESLRINLLCYTIQHN